MLTARRAGRRGRRGRDVRHGHPRQEGAGSGRARDTSRGASCPSSPTSRARGRPRRPPESSSRPSGSWPGGHRGEPRACGRAGGGVASRDDRGFGSMARPADWPLHQLSRHYLPLHDSLLLMFRKRGPLQFWGAVHARSAPMVSRGKTYRYQKFLCTTGSQICQAGLRYTLICPAWHRLCVRAPTPRFRAVTPTYGGIYHRASHAALPGFPAPPHNRLRAPQSCRHCQPCACDER